MDKNEAVQKMMLGKMGNHLQKKIKSLSYTTHIKSLKRAQT